MGRRKQKAVTDDDHHRYHYITKWGWSYNELMISGSSYDEQIDRSQSPFLFAPQKKESHSQAGSDNKQKLLVYWSSPENHNFLFGLYSVIVF